MKALREIGFIKAFRFIIFSLYASVFNSIFLFPFRPMLLRMAGARIGKNTILHKVSFFNHYQQGFSNLIIGNECFIGDEVSLDLSNHINLEDHATLANRVMVLTHTNVGYKNHPLQEFFPKFTKKVYIKKGAFIGANAIILPGVTIGECSMIGAGSIVTKNIPDWVVAFGSPAKVIKEIKH